MNRGRVTRVMNVSELEYLAAIDHLNVDEERTTGETVVWFHGDLGDLITEVAETIARLGADQETTAGLNRLWQKLMHAVRHPDSIQIKVQTNRPKWSKR